MGVHRVGSTVKRPSQGRIREPLGAQQMTTVDETQVLIDGNDKSCLSALAVSVGPKSCPGSKTTSSHSTRAA